MNPNGRQKLILHITEAVYSVILLGWFLLPLADPMLGGFDPRTLPLTLFGWPPASTTSYVVVSVLVHLIPLIAAWKIAALFVGLLLPSFAPAFVDPQRPLPAIFNILSSGFAVAAVVLHAVAFAASARYFASFPPVTYGVAGLSIVYNAFFAVMLIMSLGRRDAGYQEYLVFRRTGEQRPKNVLSAVQRQGIQRKLLQTFVPLIVVIIVVLSIIQLRNFYLTILNAVITNGEALVERTASVVKANVSDRISIEDYFAIEAKKNAAANATASTFRFNSLSFYKRDAQSGDFAVAASTDGKRLGTRAPKRDTALAQTSFRYNAGAATYEFLAPVTLSNVFLGYAMVDYARDIILEPYFRTEVMVFVIAGLAIYLSVFLIYIFGRAIVFPILFLRMSVNAIANVLAGMIKGKLKISTDLLQYRDRVHTRDEIKLLSTEVKNMTTVIRGVIPYISASTLKHAEREAPMTESKNLTFLFTDIRGFTTLCEGMKPENVVEVLNHILDLQSSIILSNGGDVDKFVGDEIMAMFDGPRKEINACKTGLEIRRAINKEGELAEAASRNIISIGIGINTGPVVFGSVGAKDRMDFTSIGDTVNLAARLEGANKTYGTGSLITEAVHEKVKEAFLCREIDLLTVKGKSLPVRIFEILHEKKGVSPKIEEFKKVFETSLALYRKQKWDAAEKGFASLRDEFKDETSDVFLKRIALFRKNPLPKDWDGVFTLTVK